MLNLVDRYNNFGHHRNRWYILLQLAEDEFAEAEILAYLDISYNQIKSLNGSLRSLKSLRYLNLTHNYLTEFSLQEIKGLKKLDVIDLSHNKISHITGNMEVNIFTFLLFKKPYLLMTFNLFNCFLFSEPR